MKPISCVLVALIVMLMPALGTVSAQRTVNLDQVTIADVNSAFAKGTLTSERLVQLSWRASKRSIGRADAAVGDHHQPEGH